MLKPLKIGAIGYRINVATQYDIPADATLAVRVLSPTGEYFTVSQVTRVAARLVRIVSDADWYTDGKMDVTGQYKMEIVLTTVDGNVFPSQTFSVKVAGL